ncbi:D-alanine--D-serine ligase [Vagococcus sp. BWB3-3]|uniref:D-alanine--D-alanine ligase n=1 Tax=Vagococcus allomyrinae TaxID=2794353 RepID=A0A940P9W7_9ENTE|nr:D-alanine--D-serine ligase [Vagococcus allomyrinae]MBP1040158.1 D-alanine--D-serine ligase [Vagococcus allomyrinae]
MKQVGVIFGGASPEYEVSLESAASVLEVLEGQAYDVSKIGISRNGTWYLVKSDLTAIREDRWLNQETCQKILPDFSGQGFWLSEEKKWLTPDSLFPVLHGKYGEDGCLQGLLEMMGVPYVGCGVAASALCMNKWLLHQFAESIGIKSTPTLMLTAHEDTTKVDAFIEQQGYPLFVKPNEAGSSKGISQVTHSAGLQAALADAFQYCTEVILQKSVSGIEIGCGILGNEELTVGECDEISLVEGFFDYTEKYQLVTAKILVPASLPVVINQQIKERAQLLYRSLGCKGLARLDFFFTDEGEILLNEVNTMPGFTAHSRFPAMLAAVGFSYQQIIQTLLILAEEAHYEKHLLTVS